jgi:hypothetical protein
MSKQTEIKCDACGKDLTFWSMKTPDYRIVLHSEEIPSKGNTCLDYIKHDPIPNRRDFCSEDCLKNWIEMRLR